MSKNKLFLNPDYEAKIGYNGFNMSQNIAFTSTCGELLPVYMDLLQPGDKVDCATEMRTRTLPIESPAFLNMQENCDWFFVPLEQIYKLFGSWFFRIDDHSSSIFTIEDIIDKIPSISPATLDSLSADMRSSWKYFSQANAANFRLAEMLGCPLDGLNENVQASMAIAPIFACAYQKIYFDFYRLADREYVDPSAFNLDAYYNTGDIPLLAAKQIFSLRYAPWRKDFFTNTFVSPLFGQSSVSGIDQNNNQNIKNVGYLFNQWLNGESQNLITANTQGAPDIDTPSMVKPRQEGSGSYALTTARISQALSPTAIRTSFALHKLLEVTRRAGKHYDAQQLAHFGVKLPTGIAGEVTYLGNVSSTLHIGDIVSTADTAEGPLGQLAGKGYGYGRGGDIKFTAPCHGILMCIYHAKPEVYYSANHLDKLHTLINPADWRREEFDNLGMQPLFGYQGYLDNQVPANNSKVLGWQYRYSELKTKYDKVFGGLKTGNNLDYWIPQRDFKSNTLDSFLVDPFFLNQIMTVGYAPTVANPFNSDPLIHNFSHTVRKASKMSEYGLEQL